MPRLLRSTLTILPVSLLGPGLWLLVPFSGRCGPQCHFCPPASSLATAVSTSFPSLEARSHFRSSRRVMFPVISSPFPPQRLQNRAGGTLEVGGGDGGHHRPSRRRRPWGYAPAAASSTGETSGTFPSRTVPRAPLESAEEVEVYELYHVALADGLISRTKEVVVDGRYDLDLLDRAVVVSVVPNDQRVRGVNFAKIQPKDLEIVVGDVPQSLGNAPGQLVAAEVQGFQVGEAAQLPGDRPSQPVAAEVQGLQVGEAAQLCRDRPSQLVEAEVQRFQVGEVAQRPGDPGLLAVDPVAGRLVPTNVLRL